VIEIGDTYVPIASGADCNGQKRVSSDVNLRLEVSCAPLDAELETLDDALLLRAAYYRLEKRPQ
jgi:hypothetical protein